MWRRNTPLLHADTAAGHNERTYIPGALGWANASMHVRMDFIGAAFPACGISSDSYCLHNRGTGRGGTSLRPRVVFCFFVIAADGDDLKIRLGRQFIRGDEGVLRITVFHAFAYQKKGGGDGIRPQGWPDFFCGDIGGVFDSTISPQRGLSSRRMLDIGEECCYNDIDLI